MDVGDRVGLGVDLGVGVRRGVAAAVVVGQQHRLERQPVDHHLPPGGPAPAERRDGEEDQDAGVDPEAVGRHAHQLDEQQQADGVRREGGVAHVAPAPSGPAHPLRADDAVAGLLGEVGRGHPAMLTGERSQTRLGAMSTRAQRYDAVVLSRARISAASAPADPLRARVWSRPGSPTSGSAWWCPDSSRCATTRCARCATTASCSTSSCTTRAWSPSGRTRRLRGRPGRGHRRPGLVRAARRRGLAAARRRPDRRCRRWPGSPSISSVERSTPGSGPRCPTT